MRIVTILVALNGLVAEGRHYMGTRGRGGGDIDVAAQQPHKPPSTSSVDQ